MELKDPRPYMLQAHIRWLEDSAAAPHLVIQNGPKTLFPAHLTANSVVTFRVTSESIRNLNIDDQGLSFSARFSGKEFTVYAPLDCIMQLHSENGKVIIQLQKPAEVINLPEVLPPVLVEQPSQPKPINGSSNGVKRGKLFLVPKTQPSVEPGDPECA